MSNQISPVQVILTYHALLCVKMKTELKELSPVIMSGHCLSDIFSPEMCYELPDVLSLTSTLQPSASIHRKTSRLAPSTAQCNDVQPVLSMVSQGAPCARNSFTTSSWPGK